MQQYLYVNVWRKDALVEEKDLSDMKYKNGLMLVNGTEYAIKIMEMTRIK